MQEKKNKVIGHGKGMEKAGKDDKTGKALRNEYKYFFDQKKVEDIRANHMATGGGTPIPKGHKRTNEHRVLQPRDPETGEFADNASANLERKYEQHSERNGYERKGGKESQRRLPVALKREVKDLFESKDDVMRGDFITVEGRRIVAAMSMTKDQFREMLGNLRHTESGEGVLVGEGTSGKGKAVAVTGENFAEYYGTAKAGAKNIYDQLSASRVRHILGSASKEKTIPNLKSKYLASDDGKGVAGFKAAKSMSEAIDQKLAASDPKKWAEEHKEIVDDAMKQFKDAGMDVTVDDFVSRIAGSTEEELAQMFSL